MKTYKILSIAFIVICVGLMVAVLTSSMVDAGRKTVLMVCLALVVAAMAFNLSMIRKKQKQQ